MKLKNGLIWMVVAVSLMVPGLEGAMAHDGAASPPARVVTAPVIERVVAESTKVLGTLFFDRVSNLSTEVGGLVSSVHFNEGDRLKQGAVMFRLNTDFIDNEIESVLAQMDQVRVRLAKAEKDLGRYKTLFDQEAVSETEYDNILLSKEELVKQTVILEKQLEFARLKRAKSVIRSPFDGLVLEKTAEKGDWVSQGSRLCAMGSMDDLFVKVPVSEDFLVFAQKGEQVEVSIDSLGKRLMGVVDGVIPVADPQTKSVFVKVKLPQLENPVLNMSATVSMPVASKKNMLLVPRDALVNFNGQNMVYTVADGKATPMPVTILAYVGDHVAIASGGFKAGMPLVVDGNARLRPGQAVTIIN
ncbi:putative membrane-fusion protein [Desulforapulum autotrophicum HRM2]|jgi:RND family efflux transporter MFP subunit|uniref:Membrane-fusion protein n=1 Tax=Desulforapulum autotrophicum (strain ATCC 43914 / DSM 3382 / VKM B-1955 / HRM2) TaxID=177437 RepID=C0QIE2_DESAH|nr:efflux RND transporter periplasmic adaptor subunit [Desulforapulum autotrophicum]ACN17886.1 putative membrane-fusion protein [Desulforapulum autotrophicum HRM2]